MKIHRPRNQVLVPMWRNDYIRALDLLARLPIPFLNQLPPLIQTSKPAISQTAIFEQPSISDQNEVINHLVPRRRLHFHCVFTGNQLSRQWNMPWASRRWSNSSKFTRHDLRSLLERRFRKWRPYCGERTASLRYQRAYYLVCLSLDCFSSERRGPANWTASIVWACKWHCQSRLWRVWKCTFIQQWCQPGRVDFQRCHRNCGQRRPLLKLIVVRLKVTDQKWQGDRASA